MLLLQAGGELVKFCCPRGTKQIRFLELVQSSSLAKQTTGHERPIMPSASCCFDLTGTLKALKQAGSNKRVREKKP